MHFEFIDTEPCRLHSTAFPSKRPEDHWPRRPAIFLVENRRFDTFILLTIITNCVTMAWESPLDPDYGPKADFIDVRPRAAAAPPSKRARSGSRARRARRAGTANTLLPSSRAAAALARSPHPRARAWASWFCSMCSWPRWQKMSGCEPSMAIAASKSARAGSRRTTSPRRTHAPEARALEEHASHTPPHPCIPFRTLAQPCTALPTLPRTRGSSA